MDMAKYFNKLNEAYGDHEELMDDFYSIGQQLEDALSEEDSEPEDLDIDYSSEYLHEAEATLENVICELKKIQKIMREADSCLPSRLKYP